ncbi:hypothetical protein [Psittacicella hinzii]|uniref:hypothetical protein n=1 Tax=Psittacicella hinzii TaxID=2028575 RepID=UPI001CA71C25|nr:hypothetical protein [Psittacicella hinzii]
MVKQVGKIGKSFLVMLDSLGLVLVIASVIDFSRDSARVSAKNLARDLALVLAKALAIVSVKALVDTCF